MADDIRFSEAELELMAILWSRSPLAASEIIESAPAEREWSATTVKTMLARLVDKGALRTKSQGRRFLYTPTVERESVAADQAGRLVDRLFGGRLSPLVAHLAANRDLSEEDVAELEALVKGLRK